MPTRYNLHTHTFRCTHANGSEEEMVQAAIQEGYQVLGFSEHVPLPHYRRFLFKALPYALTGIHPVLSLGKAMLLNGPGMRMPYPEKKAHEKAVSQCQRKYQNEIRIYLGYECEYFKEYLDYYRQLDCDYLMLGHHYHQYPLYNRYNGGAHLSRESAVCYLTEADEALKTGLFRIFAHPDLFCAGFQDFDDEIDQLILNVVTTCNQFHIPLEFNAGGWRRNPDHPPYPNRHFWELVRRGGGQVVIGMDAHDPAHLDHRVYDLLREQAKSWGLAIVTI